MDVQSLVQVANIAQSSNAAAEMPQDSNEGYCLENAEVDFIDEMPAQQQRIVTSPIAAAPSNGNAAGNETAPIQGEAVGAQQIGANVELVEVDGVTYTRQQAYQRGAEYQHYNEFDDDEAEELASGGSTPSLNFENDDPHDVTWEPNDMEE